MSNLNPEGIDFSHQNKLPFFNPVKKYFAKIKLQEANISTLLENLKNEQEILNENNQINMTKDSSEKIQINSNITNKSVSINNIILNPNHDNILYI